MILWFKHQYIHIIRFFRTQNLLFEVMDRVFNEPKDVIFMCQVCGIIKLDFDVLIIL